MRRIITDYNIKLEDYSERVWWGGMGEGGEEDGDYKQRLRKRRKKYIYTNVRGWQNT